MRALSTLEETSHRFFAQCIACLLLLAEEVIQPLDRSFSSTLPEILYERRYMMYFKDCIEAIDGTHLDSCIPVGEHVPYIERHDKITQNVATTFDFNMCFTFGMSGWEGCTHDNMIFSYAISDPRYQFPHPPRGKYYLVDSGYTLQRGYLKPFKDTRYHLPDFARGGCQQKDA